MAIKIITRKRGDTYPIKIVVKEGGAVVDITGFSLLFSVSVVAEPTEADYVFQSVGTVSDGPAGQAFFPLTDADANNIGEFYFDIQVLDTDTKKHTPLAGKIKFKQDITKD